METTSKDFAAMLLDQQGNLFTGQYIKKTGKNKNKGYTGSTRKFQIFLIVERDADNIPTKLKETKIPIRLNMDNRNPVARINFGALKHGDIIYDFGMVTLDKKLELEERNKANQNVTKMKDGFIMNPYQDFANVILRDEVMWDSFDDSNEVLRFDNNIEQQSYESAKMELDKEVLLVIESIQKNMAKTYIFISQLCDDVYHKRFNSSGRIKSMKGDKSKEDISAACDRLSKKGLIYKYDNPAKPDNYSVQFKFKKIKEEPSNTIGDNLPAIAATALKSSIQYGGKIHRAVKIVYLSEEEVINQPEISIEPIKEETPVITIEAITVPQESIIEQQTEEVNKILIETRLKELEAERSRLLLDKEKLDLAFEEAKKNSLLELERIEAEYKNKIEEAKLNFFNKQMEYTDQVRPIDINIDRVDKIIISEQTTVDLLTDFLTKQHSEVA